MLGLTQVQKRSYVTLCMCRLTLAWVTSENSTTLLECRLIFPHCRWTSSHANWSLSSGVDWSLSSPFANFPLLSPFVSLSDWRSLPTSGHAEISSPKPFSGFAPKQTKELSAWWTTYIVLQAEVPLKIIFSYARSK